LVRIIAKIRARLDSTINVAIQADSIHKVKLLETIKDSFILKDSMKLSSDSLLHQKQTVLELSDSTQKDRAIGVLENDLKQKNGIYKQTKPRDLLTDSTKKQELLQRTNEQAQTLLKNELNVSISLDSSLISTSKKAAGEKVKEAIENKTSKDIPDLQIDSTLAEQGKKHAQNKLNDQLNAQTGLSLSDLKVDSTLSKKVKSKFKSETKELLEEKTNVDLPDMAFDSAGKAAIVTHVEQLSEQQIKQYAGADFKSQMTELEAHKNQMAQAQSDSAYKQKLIAYAEDYALQNIEKVKMLQVKMEAHKKKYSTLTNSEDLSTAQKRSSLSGDPFWKRLVIGGNFSLVGIEPIVIDLSPVLGWKFNKYLELGINATNRSQYSFGKNTGTGPPIPEYGYGAFMSHSLLKKFFIYFELGRMYNNVMSNSAETNLWQEYLLAGIGKEIRISSFLEMQAIITYNILNKSQPGIFNSPFVFKTGFRLSK